MAKSKSSKKTIFLIEDNKDIIDVYTMAFDAAGITLESFTLGKEALERVHAIAEGKEEKPALVLLDLMLPDINGFEILKEIKQNEKTKDMVVFILSNYTISDEQKAEAIQPEKYILKANITPSQLISMVKEQIK